MRRSSYPIRILTSILAVGLWLLLAPLSKAFAATYYVSPSGNDSNTGTTEAQSWRTIQRAGDAVSPGDTVLIAPGTYNGSSGQQSVLYPRTSGTASAPITFKSLNSTRPVLSGINTGKDVINLTDRNYIVIDNLQLQDPCSNWCRWLTLENANHNTVNNTRFVMTRASTGVDWIGINFQNATYNKLTNCHVDGWGVYGDPYNNGGDAVQLNGASHHNLIEGCFIGAAGHAGLQLDGGDTYFNVIRNNTFQNRLEKAFETTQRRAGRFEYNLFEGNTCIDSRYNSELHGGMCLHINANRNIIRRNVLRGALGWAIDMQVWGAETLNNIGNHVFHNTIVNNGIDQSVYHVQATTGIAIEDFGYTAAPHRDHRIKNNIIYDNKPQTNFSPPRNVQILLGFDGSRSGAPFSGVQVAGNLLHGNSDTNETITVYGMAEGTAQSYNQSHPNNFWGNISQAPQFVAYDQGVANNPLDGTFDLRLQAGSPGIDQGVSLTQTTAAGSGTVVPVQDAGYFQDGFDGIIAPDQIRVGNNLVTISDIDYGNNRITVDRSISWAAGDGVNLPFSGNAPDIGAYEANGSGGPQTSSTPSPVASVVPSPSPSATPNTQACRAADINQDNTVNQTDRTLLINDFFKRLPVTPRADINADGIVDITDYGLLVQSYQQTCQ